MTVDPEILEGREIPYIGDVVEVQECRSYRLANLYLEHGYRMLSVQTVHYGDDNKPLRRGAQYVVGREAHVPHFDPPRKPERVSFDAGHPEGDHER